MRKAPGELLQFLSAFDPAISRLFLGTRRLVLGYAPEANELIYDAYNAVSAAYSFTGRLKEAFCHVAAYPGHVNLGFNRGAELADPDGVLVGSGTHIRHLRIETLKDLRSPALQAFVRAAAERGESLALAPLAKPASIIKPTTGAKRRPVGPGMDIEPLIGRATPACSDYPPNVRDSSTRSRTTSTRGSSRASTPRRCARRSPSA